MRDRLMVLALLLIGAGTIAMIIAIVSEIERSGSVPYGMLLVLFLLLLGAFQLPPGNY